jgi:hypothetical protein
MLWLGNQLQKLSGRSGRPRLVSRARGSSVLRRSSGAGTRHDILATGVLADAVEPSAVLSSKVSNCPAKLGDCSSIDSAGVTI